MATFFQSSGGSRRYRGRKASRSTIPYVLRPILGSVCQAFLELYGEQLDELFVEYGLAHGKAAEAYARKTFPAWRRGDTNLSGQTMERLISLVPPHLTTEQRVALLKQLARPHEYRTTGRKSVGITINAEAPQEGFDRVEAGFESLKFDEALLSLPEHLMQAATWLYDDDVTAARGILAEAKRLETNAVLEQARKDVDLLKRTVQSQQVQQASYSVTLPAGTLSISVYTPHKDIFTRLANWFGS